MARTEARIVARAELAVGLKTSFERQITSEDIEGFAALSGDQNPLHVDDRYAQQTNYGRRIVHGAFQVGLASTMAGMYLPGRNVVVGSMRARFPSPLHYPSTVSVHGEITAWLPRTGNGSLKVRVVEQSQSQLTAEIDVGFGLHDNGEQKVAVSPVAADRHNPGLPVVVLTGAGSSVGPYLYEQLSRRYQVLGLVRSGARAAHLLGGRDVELVECDLISEDWELALDAALGGRPAYGLVHAAWPGAPQGGLMGLDLETVLRQVEFGTLTTIRLARWLVRHAKGSGRMVVLGSTATIKPVLNLAGYSLGKAAMEQTVRLLAPELAGRGVSINAVLPSFMPQGMNQTKTRQAILTETAKVPLGRLCAPDDLAAVIEYLLSEKSGFLAGQILPLTGGQP